MKSNPPIKGHELIAEGRITRHASGQVFGGCRCGERPDGWETMSMTAIRRWHRDEHKESVRLAAGYQARATAPRTLTVADEEMLFELLTRVGATKNKELQLVESEVWCDYHGEVHAAMRDIYEESGNGCSEQNWRPLWTEADAL